MSQLDAFLLGWFCCVVFIWLVNGIAKAFGNPPESKP